ncbi:MAG: hypothetical protein LBK99_04050 [Opitutaceae bacterium]|nr:hypothetical protein [Opitutaceae bacterium]
MARSTSLDATAHSPLPRQPWSGAIPGLPTPHLASAIRPAICHQHPDPLR